MRLTPICFWITCFRAYWFEEPRVISIHSGLTVNLGFSHNIKIAWCKKIQIMKPVIEKSNLERGGGNLSTFLLYTAYTVMLYILADIFYQGVSHEYPKDISSNNELVFPKLQTYCDINCLYKFLHFSKHFKLSTQVIVAPIKICS